LSEDVSIDRLKSHVISLCFVRHPESNPNGLEKARGYIWNQMMESGCYMLAQSWRSGKLVFHNVVGEKAAGFHAPPTLIVVAHYDTVDNSPGAGVNASGVAVMLEASRIIGTSGIPVRVFFAAVSMKELWQGSSLRGSETLVANLRSRGIPVTAAICLDSVGVAGQMRQATPEGMTPALPAKGDFLAVVGCETTKALVDAFSASCKASVASLPTFPIILPGNGETSLEWLRGDQATFWATGYQALLLTDTGASRSSSYHAPSDTPDRLNYAFMADVCRSVVAYAKILSNKA
jgi:Zn-dependent M28 family amino/carboxypeptidase